MQSVNGLVVRRGLDSPDNDSAFSDNSFSSADSWPLNATLQPLLRQGDPRAPLHRLSNQQQQQQQQQQAVVHQLQQQQQIQLSARRVMAFTVYTPDGRAQAVRAEASATTAADLITELIMRTGVALDPSWSIVECNLENHTERCLEDYELLSECMNMCEGVKSVGEKSPSNQSKLVFSPRPSKYDLFRRPERYINDVGAGESASESLSEVRHRLLHSLFYGSEHEDEEARLESHLSADGVLYMKTEGKRSWRKHHFVLRASGLFYAPKGVKRQTTSGDFRMEELVFVCDFVTHRVAIGSGWKKKYKAPHDSCFALVKRPDAFQGANSDPVPDIVHLCADNEAVMFKWTTAIRLFHNRRQVLMAYNRMLTLCQGEEPRRSSDNVKSDANMDGNTAAATATAAVTALSVTSSSESESVTSGCASEVSSVSEEVETEETEESASFFNADCVDNGTIKRKPTSMLGNTQGNSQSNMEMEESGNLCLILPPPPPELLADETAGSTLSLHSLPPPPEELRITSLLSSTQTNNVVVSPRREPLYPCGAFRSLFPKEQQRNQMELLKLMNNAAPLPHMATERNGEEGEGLSTLVRRVKRISFDEVVRHIDDAQSTSPLKGDASSTEKVSQWILESSMHQTTTNYEQRPALYNGRRVPNCYPPHAQEEWAAVNKAPQPPMRSQNTHLTPFFNANMELHPRH